MKGNFVIAVVAWAVVWASEWISVGDRGIDSNSCYR